MQLPTKVMIGALASSSSRLAGRMALRTSAVRMGLDTEEGKAWHAVRAH
jgi:hypothetical protein